ncbi:MAG: hypothetical protein ACYDEV_00275 [Acidiferrobacter sp.]
MDIEQDKTVITDIDPLAKSPPHDIHEAKSEMALAPVAKPASLTAGLANDIQKGGMEERFTTLINKISGWSLDQAVTALLPQVNATRLLNAWERKQRIRELLSDQRQRVFNLISHTLKMFATQLRADPKLAALAPSLDALMAADPNSQTGITQVASSALELGLDALTAHICQELDAADMDLAQMRLLLEGGPGAAIAAEPVLECILGNFR